MSLAIGSIRKVMTNEYRLIIFIRSTLKLMIKLTATEMSIPGSYHTLSSQQERDKGFGNPWKMIRIDRSILK